MRVAFFVGVLSLFLFIANAVVFEALADIVSISALWQLIGLGALLFVLSGSFIAATLLGMHYYNFFTRAYYTLSAMWIGCFVYLFFASVLYGLISIFFGTAAVIGMALMAAALVVSIYGILHTKYIRIKKVTVSLPHLPVSWQGKVAIWMSDLHLGQVYGPSFARKVVRLVANVPHAIIFIGGDLFDGTGAPDINELIAPLKKLAAPWGVYFITGNHEEFGSSEKFISAVKNIGMHLLQDQMVDIEGMQLIGVNYHNAANAERFKNILANLTIDRQKPSILLKHEPNDLDVAEAAFISLQISGHTHRAQMWPLEYMARLTYKGFVYGLKNFKNMQVLISSGTGTWGPPLRVGTDCEIVALTFTSSQ